MFKGKNAKTKKDINREKKSDNSAQHIVIGKIDDGSLYKRADDVKGKVTKATFQYAFFGKRKGK